jgi:hypothetical protein
LEDTISGPKARRDRAILSRRRLLQPTENATRLSVSKRDLSNASPDGIGETSHRGGRRSRTSKSPAMRRSQHVVGWGALGYSDSDDSDSDFGSPRVYDQSLPSHRPALSRRTSASSTSLMRSPSLRVVPLTWSPLNQTLSDEYNSNDDRGSDDVLDSSSSSDDPAFGSESRTIVYRPRSVKVIEEPPTPTTSEGFEPGARPPTTGVESLRSDVADLGDQGGSVLFDRPIKELPKKRPSSPIISALNLTLPSVTKASIFGGLFPSQRAMPLAEENVTKIQHDLPTRETSICSHCHRMASQCAIW